MKNIIQFYLGLLLFVSCNESFNKRSIISLNGSWENSSTKSISERPTAFNGKVPVPGLVDMADAPIDTNYGLIYWGPKLAPDSPIRDSVKFNTKTIYWYRKTFAINDKDNGKDVIQLKINKSWYHTWVYLNGKFVGENVYCFTPSYFDLKPFVKPSGQENELLVAVGCANNLPDTVVNGIDIEKMNYIPGIYDDVKLNISQFPFINNIQTAPDINKREVRIVAEILTDKKDLPVNVSYSVMETISKKIVAKGTVKQETHLENGIGKIDFNVSLPNFKLWSPETPFLYDLELSTEGDNTHARFGMRTFSASQDSGVVLLNGKPYFMRGSSITAYRFFEDSDRGNLPWDNSWVTKLHEKFKDMHWNSLRYCIGFPPERWYEIADSLGFLIQDEYPIWLTDLPEKRSLSRGVKSSNLAKEYEQWMRERWNHACVVIWDAQNESVITETGNAINKVRSLDLSNRPWDNGWAAPASKHDVVESHPYIYNKVHTEARKRKFVIKENILKDNYSMPRYPNIRTPAPDGEFNRHPVIINEYEWLWLNREGLPTPLTENVYNWFFPEADTPEKRFEVYAKKLGMITEYWRVHRKCAGVLYYGALASSRSVAPFYQTCDNWKDVKNLEWDPYFYQYLKPAFSPVGLMIDLWDEKLDAASEIDVKINLINDTYEPWKGSVKLSLISDKQVLSEQNFNVDLISLDKKILSIPVKLSETTGKKTLVAEIIYNGESVKSVREFVLE